MRFKRCFTRTCGTDAANGGEDCVDDGVISLRDAFGSFGDSLLTVFASALGGFDFTIFDDAVEDTCRCDLPQGARHAAIFLMVSYLITVAVVLLNLLIAVLSTAHNEVYANAENELHLARSRLIRQSGRAVARRRFPPPFNLLKALFCVVVDTGSEVYRFWVWTRR